MSGFAFVCPIVPEESFDYTPGQTKYTEQLSFVVLHNMSLAAANGAEFHFMSEDDIAADDALFTGVLNDWATYFEAIFGARGVSRSAESAFSSESCQLDFFPSDVIQTPGKSRDTFDAPAIPSPTDIMKYRGLSWWGLIIQIGLRIGGYILQKQIDKWMGYNESGDVSGIVEELVSLRESLDAVVGLLSSFKLELENKSGRVSAGMSFIDS